MSETKINIGGRYHTEQEVMIDSSDDRKDLDDEKKRYQSSFYRSTATIKTAQPDYGSVDVVLRGSQDDDRYKPEMQI